MKKIIALLGIAVLSISCGKKENTVSVTANVSPEELLVIEGKALFESNRAACASCHKPNQKIIGPSIKEIVKVYEEQNGDMIAFLKKKAKPIVDPEQYSVMETNFAILKTMTDRELESLVAYMYSEK